MALDLGIFLQGAGSSNKVKVTDNDALAQYLKDKITSVDSSVTITERDNGSVETLDLSVAGGSDTNIANTNLTQDGHRTLTQDGYDLIFDEGLAVGTSALDSSAYLEIGGGSKGLLIPRVTTPQMDAIVLPAINLLVFNTDLEALYRHDGSNWVALSAGYGIIEVFINGESGVPTYYADLPTALNTVKTGDKNCTVRLYSDIELTSQLDITAAAGFDFRSLTIDLNGFKIYNHQANGDDMILFSFENTSSEEQELVFINGYLERLNATASAYTLFAVNTWGGLRMSNCVVYNDNYAAAYLQFNEGLSAVSNVFQDLGGSYFITSSSSDYALRLQEGKFKNFSAYNIGTYRALVTSASIVQDFYTESASDYAFYILNGTIASHFTTVSNSGIALLLANNSEVSQCSHFIARSSSSYAIFGSNNGDVFSNFDAVSESNIAVYYSADAYFSNGTAKTNTGTYAMSIGGTGGVTCENVTALSVGSGSALQIRSGGVWANNCSFTSLGGDVVVSAGDLIASNCTFRSRWNNASGHAVTLNSSNDTFVNCTFEVTNASANCLYASIARTVDASNNVMIGATTPINANVTVNASTDLGNGNRQI